MELTGFFMSVLLLLFCCYFTFSIWKTMYKKKGLPPGPTPLPLVGNLLDIKMGSLVDSLVKFSKQYGSVYTLYFGSNPVIVICGYEAVKEALIDQNDDFGGRGKLPTIDQFTKGYGIMFANGECWRVLRTFTFKTLRDFGLGKQSNQWKIQEEARCVVEEFRKCQGQPVNPTDLFMKAFCNILCSILFGDRYDYTEDKFTKLLYITEEMFQLASSTWGQEKEDPNTEFTMINLLYVIHSLFIAATESLSITLRHALLILLKHPEVEDKLHEEIDRVIGHNRIVNMDDKFKMPYTQAVIHEVQRFCDIAPFSVPHMVTKDTMFRGYHIPKGTNVYPLLWTVHRDPKKFTTPYKFNPNHFLNENGELKKNDAFMPFSIGKRSCPGEGVARMELFIFLVTTLQNFTLTSNKEFSEADVAPKLKGFVNTPIQFEVSFMPR